MVEGKMLTYHLEGVPHWFHLEMTYLKLQWLRLIGSRWCKDIDDSGSLLGKSDEPVSLSVEDMPIWFIFGILYISLSFEGLEEFMGVHVLLYFLIQLHQPAVYFISSWEQTQSHIHLHMAYLYVSLRVVFGLLIDVLCF